jgi:hypothetical protein
MEKYSLFGIIPFPIVGFLCFILAAVFLYVWPKARAKELKTLNFPKFVLHYFHPLAWVLFGMGAFWQKSAPELALIFAGLGAMVFAMFIFIFIRSQ